MSQQSVLTNNALECKNSTTTIVKQAFSNNQILFTGASGNKVKLANAEEPTVASDVATKNYVDNAVSAMNLSISWKNACRVRSTDDLDATNSSGTLTMNNNGALVIDGVTLAVNDRVLVMNQIKPSDNGIYVVGATGDASNPAHLNRASDADSAEEIIRAAVFIEEGSHSSKGYVQTASPVTTINTDDITFSTFAQVNELAVDDGLEMAGKHLKIRTNRGINIINDAVSIADSGVIESYLADGAVSQLKIGDGAVTGPKIQSGAIDSSDKFVAGVCNNAALATDCVSESKVQSSSIIERHIVPGNISRDLVANSAINGAKIASSSLQNHHYEDGSISSIKVGASEIKSINVGNGEILNQHLGNGSVTQEKLASACVTSNKILSQNIVTDLLDRTLGSQAVTEATIRDSAVTNAKLAPNACEEDNIKEDSVNANHLKDAIITDRHFGTINNLTCLGSVTAASFVAGSGSAGTSSFSLAKAALLRVQFDNAFTITNDFQQVPTSASKLTFSYNDNIAAAYPTWTAIFLTDGTVNEIETRMIARYYKNDGSETLEDNTHIIDHFQWTTHLNDTMYPEGSQSLAVKRSDPLGGEDFRLAEIYLEVKKHSSGTVTIPVNSDLTMVSIVVSEDSSTTTLTY